MKSREFAEIRRYLNRTQSQLAQLLCVSPKAVQSFEQGWRHVPVHVERQLLVLLSLKTIGDNDVSPCWEMLNCPQAWREKCIVWEYKARYFCWFFNGTYCQGQFQGSWEEKIKLCRQCAVFRAVTPAGF